MRKFKSYDGDLKYTCTTLKHVRRYLYRHILCVGCAAAAYVSVRHMHSFGDQVSMPLCLVKHLSSTKQNGKECIILCSLTLSSVIVYMPHIETDCWNQ